MKKRITVSTERDPIVWCVIEEMREWAKDGDEGSTKMREWANRLENSATAFYEDVYGQCADAIRPHVDAGRLPGSVVESFQMLVERMHVADFPPSV